MIRTCHQNHSSEAVFLDDFGSEFGVLLRVFGVFFEQNLAFFDAGAFRNLKHLARVAQNLRIDVCARKNQFFGISLLKNFHGF